MIIASIDPGLNGGVSILKCGKIHKTIKTPVIPTTEGRRINSVALSKFIKENKPECIVIEQPQVRPGENIKNHLTIGINFGIIYATAEQLGLPLHIIPASTWTHSLHSLLTGKKVWETGKSKDKSLAVFRLLYPDSKETHDGIVDAVLIGFYWLWREGKIKEYREGKK